MTNVEVEKGSRETTFSLLERKLLSGDDVTVFLRSAALLVEAQFPWLTNEQVIAISQQEGSFGPFCLCLPGLQREVDKNVGLGVEGEELILAGFTRIQEIVNGWREGVINGQPVNLRQIALRDIGKTLGKLVCDHYDIALTRIELVRIYGRIRCELEDNFGRSLTVNDFSEVERLFQIEVKFGGRTREMLRQRNLTFNEAQRDPWQGDVLKRIHDLFEPVQAEVLVVTDVVADRAINGADRAIFNILVNMTLGNTRYREVIEMRFGCPPFLKEYTLEEIAVEMGLTIERVRQIEASAIGKLRCPPMDKILRSFSLSEGGRRLYPLERRKRYDRLLREMARRGSPDAKANWRCQKREPTQPMPEIKQLTPSQRVTGQVSRWLRKLRQEFDL